MSTPSPSHRGPGAAAGVAAALTGLQAAALLGFVVYYLTRLARDGSDNTGRVVISAVLILAFALALAALARALWRRLAAARTPAIVWNVLLLPVGWGLVQSGRDGIGGAVLGVAVATIVAVIAAGPAGDEPGPDDGP